jgi:purine-nucleoside phosphorylase
LYKNKKNKEKKMSEMKQFEIYNKEKVDALILKGYEYVSKKLGEISSKIGIITGTGWGDIVNEVEIKNEIKYSEIPGVGSALVAGHAGKIVYAKYNSKDVIILQGRLHPNESYDPNQSFKMRILIGILSKLGIKKMIVTNAAGALNEDYKVSDLIIINDFISLFLASSTPLFGGEFVDFYSNMKKDLQEKAKEVLKNASIDVKEGKYVYLRGPQFESPTDKRVLLNLGADMVGMSSLQEAIICSLFKIEFFGISFITNLAFVEHSHEDNCKIAKENGYKMVSFLKGMIDKM